jgi:glycosyltransferase involved in cell wall biosynthesis
MKPKLAVVVTHPIQHFAPIYQWLAKHDRIDIVVLYLTDTGARAYYDKQFNQSLAWDIDLLSGYRHQTLRPGLDRVPKGFLKTDAPEISAILDAENPDAVLVYGYTRLINWRARWWTRSRRKRLLYCSDSVLHRKRATWRLWLKTALLPSFFHGVDVCLVAGDCNAEYFQHYGVPPERMRICPLPVDVARLRNTGGAEPKSLRGKKRVELKLQSNDFVVMMCGKLYDTKRPFDLLRAVRQLREQGLPVVALFVGSGVMLEELKREAESCGDMKSFIFSGFVNQSALPSFYAAADALAIPSSEDAHPLVATEAAVFGLPLVVSDEVGCIGPTDVARKGANALVYRCGDVTALAAHIRQLQQSPDLCQKMGNASLEIAQTQDVSVAALAIETALLGEAA